MKTLIGILVFFAFTLPSFAIGVTPPGGVVSLPTINENPTTAIASIIRFFIFLTSVLAIMAITWWGIGFILATGDDEKMKKARKTIIFAFVWLVVAGLAYSIVEIITRANLN